MSDRPVYIPSRKRKKKQSFHAAALTTHPNDSVGGTKEGWVPEENKEVISKRQQKPEDFMDEQDHNEWFGPTSVREEYTAANNNTKKTAAIKHDAMLDLVQPPAQNVGPRLLRILGWRDGSTAYVPRDDTTATLLKPTEQSVESLLSSRRLRKIQLQQTRVKIPPPKLDTCGLGYEPHHNAPEFRAHRERRRKEAQERAKAVTASSGANRNVYRLSDLLDKDDADEEHNRQIQHGYEEEDNPLVSYETEQSFVGTKTVGGFALREDDDDVYDDHGKESKLNREEYDTEVYEHASDVEDEDTKGEAATGEAFGSVFASWATSKTDHPKTSTGGITSDGRPPLPGFALGASSTSKTAKRYPGPDIPTGYEPKRHEFGNEEYPGAWKDESHAAQQELMEQRRKAIQAERKAQAVKKEKERESGPMAGAAFAGLAAAMKNRFTSSATSENGGKPIAVGLQRPQATGVPLPPEPVSLKEPAPLPISIHRTTMTFVPESLLCKRFGVVVPAHAKPSLVGNKAVESKGEHAYFEREILSKAALSNGSDVATKKNPASTNKASALQDESTEARVDTRPSMKVLESIFEPQSESSESEEEIVKSESVATGAQDQLSGLPVQAPTVPPPGIPDDILAPAAESAQLVQEEREEEQRESRKHRRRKSKDDDDHKRRRRKSRSGSPSSSSDRSRRRKRSRKRDEKKKRKKRHKSSKRSRSD